MTQTADFYRHDLGDVVSLKGYQYAIKGRCRVVEDDAPAYFLRPLDDSPPAVGFVRQTELDA